MGARVDITPPENPLFWDVRGDHTLELPVLGLPVQVESNSAYVVGVFEEAFGVWRNLTREATGERLRVRVFIHHGAESEGEHATVSHRVPDGRRLLMHTAGSFAIADPDRREALAYVSDTLAADREHFRLTMLESLVLALASQFDRVPLHAAAIARDGAGVLLAARSGVGKSTLAYAAHAAGLPVMSDDTVWVQRSPRSRVWGMPRRIHLTPGSEQFFPELARSTTSVLANGKVKMVVDLAQRHNGETPLVVDHVGICLVERSSGVLSLSRADPDEVVRELGTRLEPGFSLFAEQTPAYVRGLVGSFVWRLRLSGHPADAVPLLAAMLDEVSARVTPTAERR